MSDGFVVPYAHDGMGAFEGEDGRVILVCNHEIPPSHLHRSGFNEKMEHARQFREQFYDFGSGVTPGGGGTTTTIYDPATGQGRAPAPESGRNGNELCGRHHALAHVAQLRGGFEGPAPARSMGGR